MNEEVKTKCSVRFMRNYFPLNVSLIKMINLLNKQINQGPELIERVLELPQTIYKCV